MPTAASTIREVLIETCREVLPDVAPELIGGGSTLQGLGASSIERTDILMETLEKLGIDVPPVRLAEVRGMTLDGVAQVFARWSENA